MPTRSAFRIACLAMLCFFHSAHQLCGDVFRFKDGRVISGKARELEKAVVNKLSVRAWAVEVEPGAFIRVLESELANNGYEPLSEARQQYAANVAQIEQTVEKHLMLAGECTKHGLTDLALAHFLRVLDIDPENGPARSGAGFKQDANGRWEKKEVIMGENRGKVFYKGKWRFPETLAIEEAQEQAQRQAGLATRDLRRWHSIVISARGAANTRVNEALQGIAAIKDPLTTSTLVEFLLESKKPAPPDLRLMYVKLLSQFESFDAARALARASIQDPEIQIRNACLNSLRNYGREVAIPIYIGYLGDKNNLLVNAAADALGDLTAENAILPLVDALITKHIQENKGAGINASPTSGSFSMGGPSSVEVELQNPSVSSTLQRLTGQSFGFDKSAWIAWYASVHAPPAGDLRRDP